MNEQIVTLDIRDEVARTPEPWEPLSKIIWTASELQPKQTLVLVTSFDPVLLIRILGAMGFSHQSELTAGGAWNVSFYPRPATAGVEPDATPNAAVQSDPTATVQATATDNCDGNPVITFSDTVAGGPCPAEEVITRTWTATEACGAVDPIQLDNSYERKWNWRSHDRN